MWVRAGVPLPNLLVIGAMKCGTSALHTHLDRHPEIAMAPGKELNFFFGSEAKPPPPESEWWRHGQWHRGLEWYQSQFDPTARLRGESSPGYTDPRHPQAASRIRSVAPQARLVYSVREPLSRALSQWRHHRRDGTEPRPAEEALLDPDSDYVARSRYLERLRPFLDVFDAEQVLVVVQERLRRDPRPTFRRIFEHVGADPAFWDAALSDEVHVGAAEAEADQAATDRLRSAFLSEVDDDVAGLCKLFGDLLPEWSHR